MVSNWHHACTQFGCSQSQHQAYHEESNLAYEENLARSSDAHLSQRLPMNLDDTELNALFTTCMPKLARTASRMLRNSQDSEDVLQEGFLSAFRNLAQFQGRSKFSTWLYSVIRNAAKMHGRKIGSRLLYSIEEELSDGNGFSLEKALGDRKPNPEEIFAQKERSRILMTTLRDLPPMYQRVIQLCDIQGLDGRDAAATLGLSVAALKTCLHRARRLASRKIRESYLPGGNHSSDRRPINVRRRRRFNIHVDHKTAEVSRNP